MQRALVIGATGFVGGHILRAVVHSDLQATAMRRWKSDVSLLRKLGVPTLVADLLDRTSLVESIAGFNYVFMAAAPRPGGSKRSYLHDSVIGMRHLLEVCREADVERVVITSCASTVAASSHGAASTSTDVYLPGTADSEVVEAQYAIEQECFRQAADGMDLVILNPGICVGKESVLPARQTLSGVGDEARINVVDVDDVARAHVRAASRRGFGERFVLGGENTTIGELYARLDPPGADVARLGRYQVRLEDREDGLRHRALFGSGAWLDSSRAEREFGFRPRSL